MLSATAAGKGKWIMGEEAFNAKAKHHEGMKALWEAKWKFPCSKSIYPFHDGLFEDFEPVFNELIEKNINDGYSSEYTDTFLPYAAKLTKQGDEVVSKDKDKASSLYLRAACLYRIARFPYIYTPESAAPIGGGTSDGPSKAKAWKLQKEVYLKAGKLWDSPITEVKIPHTSGTGNEGIDIPVYVRFPKSPSGSHQKWPAVLLITGLDGYRPDNTQRTNEFLDRSWASIIAEIPGTADCPSDPSDPRAPDRLYSSILSWMKKDGRFDMDKLMVWGLSSGGYYAIRVAHTHKDSFKGVVAQGAGVHLGFGEDWLRKAEGHEYPFKLAPAFSKKFGYDNIEEFWKGAQKKFSLLESGIIKGPSTRLLLVNGTADGLMPIEDSMLLFEYGTAKEARFFTDALHMGYPLANSSVYPWMESVMSS